MKKSMTLVSTVVVAAGCIGVSFASASQQNPTFTAENDFSVGDIDGW